MKKEVLFVQGSGLSKALEHALYCEVAFAAEKADGCVVARVHREGLASFVVVTTDRERLKALLRSLWPLDLTFR